MNLAAKIENRRVPQTLEEAYRLRDESENSDERDFYQQCVYRLRAEKYRSRNIDTKISIQRREKYRAERLRAREETRAHQAERRERDSRWAWIFG